MRHRSLAFCALIGLSSAGCASSDRAVFVTNTAFGLNLDTTPSSISIAYDRTEGYLGPTYENGAAPAILGTLETDGNFIAPKVRQIYGTGQAAVISSRTDDGTGKKDTSGGNGEKGVRPELTGNRQLAFIGTSTTLGIKAAFSDLAVSSVNLGFKRKEFSSIQLGKADGKDVYPSVLASVDMTVSEFTSKDIELKTRQFISTGEAAENLAGSTAGKALRAAAGHAAETTAGRALLEAQASDQATVFSYVTVNGVWDQERLKAVLSKAAARNDGALPARNVKALQGAKNAEELKSMIGPNLTLWGDLAAAAKEGGE